MSDFLKELFSRVVEQNYALGHISIENNLSLFIIYLTFNAYIAHFKHHLYYFVSLCLLFSFFIFITEKTADVTIQLRFLIKSQKQKG